MYRDDQVGAEEAVVAPARDRGAEGAGAGLPWVHVAPGAPYFTTEDGAPWTPVGQNDAISWVEFEGLYRGRDLPAVEAHVAHLRAHGVTCLRLMMEYAQVRHRYFERPMGRPVPAMVRLWDDLFAICERQGMRILLTPFDTFWTWRHWRHHPYNKRNGGRLDKPSRLLLCPDTREAIKARLAFAAARWGGSGALFAWDLWNEIHPAQAGDSADGFGAFIHDLSRHVREVETRLHGRSHPQTVSLFGPEIDWKPHMEMREPIYRHPDLDFATIHIYEHGTIDTPRDTVTPALGMARIVRQSLAEIRDGRPFLDTEHGPIHTFKDNKRTLPEPFDDEYFRHIQWAHIAAGGAGGGMRWPNRSPHKLTLGMRQAQAAMAGFLPLIDWTRFRRINLSEEVEVSEPKVARVACGDEAQAIVWLVRRDTIGRDKRLKRDAKPVRPRLRVPGLAPGRYRMTAWDTIEGAPRDVVEVEAGASGLEFEAPPLVADLALAIRRA